MALTFDIVSQFVIGNKRMHFVEVDFDSSYPTGGESLTAANMGLSLIDRVWVPDKSGYGFEYDYTNSKLKAYYPRATITSTLVARPPQVTHADTAVTAHTATAVSAHATGATTVTSDAASMAAHTVTQPGDHTVTQPSAHATATCTITGVAGVAAGAGAEVTSAADLSAMTAVLVIAVGN